MPPATTLAAICTAPGAALELRRLPVPELAPGEALVRVLATTVCGSDVHTWRGDRAAPLPSILGHEIVGVVQRLGPGTALTSPDGRAVPVGTRVTWSVAASCGSCPSCLRDLPQKCDALVKYGHEPLDGPHPLSGGLAEHCVLVPGTAVVPVPEAVPDELAATASCAIATVMAALGVGRGPGRHVALLGLGALGTTAVVAARAAGAATVVAADPDPRRRALARRCGADAAVDPGSLAAAVLDASGGRGADLVVEMAGRRETVASALDLAATGGEVVLVGTVSPVGTVAVDPEQVVRRMLSIRGVHNYRPADLVAAVGLLADPVSRGLLAGLVGATYPLTRADEALADAASGRVPRVAVRPGRGDEPG